MEWRFGVTELLRLGVTEVRGSLRSGGPCGQGVTEVGEEWLLFQS